MFDSTAAKMQPIILAVETATHACSVCLLTPKGEYVEYVVEPQVHTKIILSMVDKVLHQAGVQLSEINAVAFGHGPGSFTGLRIAASVTQGLAFGANKPVIAVSSLQALAQLGHAEIGKDNVIAMIDARMHEIYWGAYSLDDSGLMQNIVADQVSREVNTTSNNQYDLRYFTQVGMGASDLTYPRAQEIAKLASKKYNDGETISPSAAIPVYIRNKIV